MHVHTCAPALVIGVCAVCGCLRAAGRDCSDMMTRYIGNKKRSLPRLQQVTAAITRGSSADVTKREPLFSSRFVVIAAAAVLLGLCVCVCVCVCVVEKPQQRHSIQRKRVVCEPNQRTISESSLVSP